MLPQSSSSSHRARHLPAVVKSLSMVECTQQCVMLYSGLHLRISPARRRSLGWCRKGVEWEEVNDLAAVAADVDVLYQTRIQKERFLDRLEDYSAARGKYIVDADLLGLMKPSACIMHPLPRVDEVRTLP